MNQIGKPDKNPAEIASEQALAQVHECLNSRKSFKLEAGAGAGKTYSLVNSLEFLITKKGKELLKNKKRIACITFTNVAKDQIDAQTDGNPVIHCNTIHSFCWSLISSFQNQLKTILPELKQWHEKLEGVDNLVSKRIEYTLGFRNISEEIISIHHDDVLFFMIKLMEFVKFRNIFSNKYPYLLIDEYQDTDSGFMETIKSYFLGKPDAPIVGLFGDHWQKIYGNGCGAVNHPDLVVIGKNANFRSVPTIVDSLNRMRPSLPQFVVDPDAEGEVVVFNTNQWNGERLTGAHFGGDLPPDTANIALDQAKEQLIQRGWDLNTNNTKILMLTHRGLATQQGYDNLLKVFKYNDSLTKKDNAHISFFVDKLEPACREFKAKHYGQMFAALGTNKNYVFGVADKSSWANSFTKLLKLRETGTVADVLSHLRKTNLPQISDDMERKEKALEGFNIEGEEEMSRSLKELKALHNILYQEITAATLYLEGHSPFETKHGVKGAQFENVIVVIGRGWNKYNFDEMLANTLNEKEIAATAQNKFENNRNLFYVVCSRPKKRLALLFTQKLSANAMKVIKDWFGKENIQNLFV